MLNIHQRKLYDAFYESTHENDILDKKTELLVGLAAAMAMDCEPCTEYYLDNAQKSGINKDEVSAVLAKVMAVAAGQKRLQTQNVINKSKINFDALK